MYNAIFFFFTLKYEKQLADFRNCDSVLLGEFEAVFLSYWENLWGRWETGQMLPPGPLDPLALMRGLWRGLNSRTSLCQIGNICRKATEWLILIKYLILCTENTTFNYFCRFYFLYGIPGSFWGSWDRQIWRALLWPQGRPWSSGSMAQQVSDSATHLLKRWDVSQWTLGRGGNWRKLVQSGCRKP